MDRPSVEFDPWEKYRHVAWKPSAEGILKSSAFQASSAVNNQMLAPFRGERQVRHPIVNSTLAHRA